MRAMRKTACVLAFKVLCCVVVECVNPPAPMLADDGASASPMMRLYEYLMGRPPIRTRRVRGHTYA